MTPSEERIRAPLAGWPLVLFVCLFLVSAAFSQQIGDATTANPGGDRPIELMGCLNGSIGEYKFSLATDKGWFVLTGQTSELRDDVGREVVLEGKRGDDLTISGFDIPRSFNVARLVQVVPVPTPQLSAAFTNRAAWQADINEQYGIEFAHPTTMTAAEDTTPPVQANFVTQDETKVVSTFTIPRDAYTNANLLGGSFTIFVNRNITDRPTCMQFGAPGPSKEAAKQYSAGGLEYMEVTGGGGGMGTWEGDYYFHVFEHGLCYELQFEVATFSARTADTGCNIPLLNTDQEINLVRPLLDTVKFLRPTVSPKLPSTPASKPEVVGFSASDQVADDALNRGVITVAWATKGAENIELTYSCVDPAAAEQGGVSSVVISEGGRERQCRNVPSFKTRSGGPLYRSPTGSIDLGLGYFNHDEPTTVIVTVTPFARAIAYPTASKSLTLTIDPYNPFSRGIPTETQNMTLSYEPGADGQAVYAQGSAMKINWTDQRTQDPCVNLYLVQDSPMGAEKFLVQINLTLAVGCLKPASRGSYTWTVTSKYTGRGFRILARTPGGTSGALGPSFEIARASIKHQLK